MLVDPPEPNRAAAEDATQLDSLRAPFGAAVVEVDLLLSDLQAPEAAPRPVPRRAASGRTALVVDPTPIARKFLALRLQKLGYAVETAEDGAQALEMLARQAFAVVFVEFVLARGSQIDGLAVCRAVKQDPRWPRAAAPGVVVVTGRTSDGDRVLAALAGCDAYLTKPLLEVQLRETLVGIDPQFR